MQGHSIDLGALFHELHFSELWQPVLEPMLVGSIPPALLTSVIVYFGTFYAVKGFQTRRRERLMTRARVRLSNPVQETV
jgi:uncharacterized protein (DUF2062 family)